MSTYSTNDILVHYAQNLNINIIIFWKETYARRGPDSAYPQTKKSIAQKLRAFSLLN